MPSSQDVITASSSVVLRIATYIFLRWFPGSFLPNVIYSAFAIFIPSFIISFLTQSPYNLISDEIDITVTDTEVEDQPPTFASTASHSHNLRTAEKPTHIEEEIDVEETVVLEEKSPKFWRTLLTGLPSPTSDLLSLLTLLLNVALVLASTDFIYRAKYQHPSHDLSFARIGYVSESEAKLLIREPDQSKMPIYVSIRLADPVPPYDTPGWLSVGGVRYLSNSSDYTAVLNVRLPKRAHVMLASHVETKYEYKTSNNHTGFFTTAPAPGVPGSDGKFTFVTSSCIIPHFPYNPLDHSLSIPGFKHLARVLPSLNARFMLFLGDFIYIDVPKRFGISVEDYRREYRQVYASPDWPSVGQNLSWIHVLDDHEIENDFDDGNSTLYNTAVDPYHIYQTAANPPLARKAGANDKVHQNATYFEFTHGPATFFMMDTRRYRDKSAVLPANGTEKSMLGPQQLADLLAFLARPVPSGVRWKFVISSIPFTKNWRVNSLDTWAGYLDERQKILEAMWDVGLNSAVGVVVLSGDRHEFAATAFPPPANGKWPISATVNEFSTSPLSQFYLPVPTYRSTDEEDVLVKYIPDGNSKFGAIEIESPESSEQSILKFRLFVDGNEAWSSILLSPPRPSGRYKRARDALWG